MAPVVENNAIDRTKLIKSYGFVEQLASNENFLRESLELAIKTADSSIAYISLLDDKKQYILSQSSSILSTINVEDSVCQYTIKENQYLEIEDARIDRRTKDLPIIHEENIAFYGGVPLTNNANIKIGALCVMDTEPKQLNESQIEILTLLGKQIMSTLDEQRSLIKLIKKINSNFKPTVCSDLSCLHSELGHLQTEVVRQHKVINTQKQDLEASNKALSEFAYMVAHDVRAPFRTIGSFAQVLSKELADKPNKRITECLFFINKAVSNANELITDLLSFAEIDKKKVPHRPIIISEILDTVLLNLNDSIVLSKAQIETPKNDYIVVGHKHHLILLFQNLIANGIKYQKAGSIPTIKIETIPQGNQISISISDNGIGISEEHFDDIFEPFKRVHNGNEYTGSGIGLATCKKILDQIGSSFTVSSKMDKGSTFMFQLPRK